ncbi:ABC transporter substrate-binding protein [Actibacterium sp. 188UL27-1]|uniref:ABC transporter substrate-binding protein n=1 Tax=Actibacterium sp. 188UL27-1 TaxID=2786961 RepID=UPI001957F93E|nr:ABC transporter substrate-binding protein [Actibacterium sp. 188UL27-1]MBM7068656.1 ABC transporter substrate-binding protein [Actibacterium sp. 188UL27-1]
MSKLPMAACLAVAALISVPFAASTASAQTQLTVAVKADRYSIKQDRFSFTTRRPAAQIAETAVKPDENFNPSPLLFQDWSYADGLYTVTLREGVTFSEGTPFNADTAIASLKLYDNNRSDFLQLDQESFEKLSDYQISFRSEVDSSMVIENMTHRGTSLFLPTGTLAENPIGTGPYLLESYEPKQQITMRRNPDYWGEAPNVETLTFRFISDDNARLLALQNGEVDVIGEVTPQMMLSMPQDGSVILHQSRPIRYAALMFNMQGNAPYDIAANDLNLRKALAHAIDRETLAQVLYGGFGQPARTILPGWMFDLGDDHAKGFTFDQAKANALLDEAGWTMGANGVRERDGRPLSLRMVAAYPNVSTVKPMPEMLDQMFAAVGVDIEIVEVDDSGVYNDTYFGPGAADMFLEFASNNNTDPTYLLYNVFTTMSPWGYAVTSPGENVDELAQASRVAGSREEVIDLVREAYRSIVDDHVSTIPILTVPNFSLSRPGITVTMSEYEDWIDYGNVSLGQ